MLNLIFFDEWGKKTSLETEYVQATLPLGEVTIYEGHASLISRCSGDIFYGSEDGKESIHVGKGTIQIGSKEVTILKD